MRNMVAFDRYDFWRSCIDWRRWASRYCQPRSAHSSVGLASLGACEAVLFAQVCYGATKERGSQKRSSSPTPQHQVCFPSKTGLFLHQTREFKAEFKAVSEAQDSVTQPVCTNNPPNHDLTGSELRRH